MITAKEIFALRKQGQLAQALEKARLGRDEQPEDAWMVKALGWTLYDHLKLALERGDEAAALDLAAEVEALNIGPEDEMLYANLQRLLNMARPGGSAFLRAKNLDKEQRHAEALDLFRQAKTAFAGQEEFHTAYGWCLSRNLAMALGRTPPDLHGAKALFDEYLELAEGKPSPLHSLMLRLLTKLMDKEASYFYQAFLRWGPENFLPADFEKYRFNAKDYPGLAEKVVQHVAKHMLDERHHPTLRSFLPVLDRVIVHAPDNIWLPYYKAKLLLSLGERELALEPLLPVVKQKRSEYWAWAALADVFASLDLDKAVSCYCVALRCPTEEKFLVNTRFAFGKLLHQIGRDAEARAELAASLKTRQEHGYGVPPLLLRLTQESWFVNAPVLKDNQDFYLKNKGLAEDLLFEGLPWMEALMGEVFSRPETPDLRLAKLYFTTGDGVKSLTTKEKTLKSLGKLKAGDPLRLRAEQQQGGRWHVLAVEVRPDGKPWDIWPAQVAVVDQVNEKKGVLHYRISRNVEGVLPLKFLPKEATVKIGTFLSLRMQEREREGSKRNEVMHCEVTDQLPSQEVFRYFSGKLKYLPGPAIGFVEQVFVDATTMRRPEVMALAGKPVEGTAVLAWNEKKKESGWRVVEIRGKFS